MPCLDSPKSEKKTSEAILSGDRTICPRTIHPQKKIEET